MNYECHITLKIGDAAIGEEVARELHWKTSRIDGDPVLGKAVYFYLTTHAVLLPRMIERLDAATAALRERGVEVVREKIEHIVYDTKRAVPWAQEVAL